MQNILRFFIISLVLFVGIYHVDAQKNKLKSDSIPIFRGLRFDLDLSPVVTGLIYSGERNSYEAGLYANIKQKYFPVVEFGFAKAQKTSAELANFKTSGTFARIGLDFNLMKPKPGKPKTNNIFFAGLRLAYSPFTYSLTNVKVSNDYWGSTLVQNFEDTKINEIWFEMVAGMRVEIAKRIYMGWTVRNKSFFGEDMPGKVQPWYVPGFGIKGTGKNWGVNYTIGYKF